MATQIVELTGDEAKLLKSLDKVIQKQLEYERKLHDTAIQGDAAGVALTDALSRVERESQDAMKGLLRDLNKVGPEGRQVSDQLKKHFGEAGKFGERSIADIIDEIERIDPESAAAARKMAANVEESADRGKTAFRSFGRSAVSEITSMVTAYLSVGAAISTVNGYLEHQRELLSEAKEAQVELATAQQESAKNLAGLTVVERNDLLQKAVPDIAASTGFGDVAEITQALGAVASAGESNAEKIKEAVEQSARIQLLTPEQLDTTAAAASAVQRQANLADIRQAIALVETTGTQARITDPQKLVESLPRAVGSLVSTVPQQDAETAARQAAALFAQITQGGNDEKGTSSSTFAIDFGTRLSKFFTELPDEQVKARSKIELIDRKIGKGTDTELDLLNKTRLSEFLKASEGLEDPKTLFGRLGAVQSDPALQRQFVGEGFGEKQFQTALTDLLDSSSPIVTALNKSFNVIQANSEFFENEAATLTGGTPQLVLANQVNRRKANRTGALVTDTEGAALSEVRETISSALTDTSSIGSYLPDAATEFGVLWGSTAAEEAISGINLLNARISELAPMDSEYGRQGVSRLQSDRNDLVDFILTSADLGSLDERGVERAQSRASRDALLSSLDGRESESQLFERIATSLEKILAANEEMVVNARDNSDALERIAAENTRGGEAPAAAPALSAATP